MNLVTLLPQILDTIAAALPVPPARQVVSPGLPAWDDCGCDGEPGQLAIRVTGVNPVYPAGGQSGCAPVMWDVNIAVSLLQCVASVNDNGMPPNSDQITGDGLEMYAAMQILLAAILCEVAALPSIDGPLTLGSWTPLDPQGGCAGGEWTFSLRLL